VLRVMVEYNSVVGSC